MACESRWLVELHDFLDRPDPACLIGRGHHVTQPGRADRRTTVLIPLLTRWLQTRYVQNDPAPHIGKARKGFRLRIADKRRTA